MLEGLICPACENTIEEIDLKRFFKCPHCATNLKSRKYLDFLEFLMANGMVEILISLINRFTVMMLMI